MYDSPTFVSLSSPKPSDLTTLQVKVFYERASSFIACTSCRNILLKQTLQEMVLPEKNIVNTSLGIYAKQILFVATIEDLRRDGLLERVVNAEDIHAVNTFKTTLVNMMNSFNDCTMDRRESVYYRRDIMPLIGNTVKMLLLGRA
jgi:hypothetical protein